MTWSGLQAELDPAEVAQALREEAGRDEQDERQGDLGGDEAAAQPQRLAPGRRRAAALAPQRARRIEPRRAVRGPDAEEDARDERERGRRSRARADRSGRRSGAGPRRRETRRAGRAASRPRASRPSAPPAIEKTRHSTIDWRSSCARLAPIARRMPYSRWRAAPRAASRPARFEQAISSTRPTIPIRETQRRPDACSRGRRAPARARQQLELLARGIPSCASSSQPVIRGSSCLEQRAVERPRARALRPRARSRASGARRSAASSPSGRRGRSRTASSAASSSSARRGPRGGPAWMPSKAFARDADDRSRAGR